MRAAVKRRRQLQDVLEIISQDRVPPTMREAVRMQGDERAADDSEECESNPRGEKDRKLPPCRCLSVRLCGGERINDAAKQNRIGELRRRECKVGASKYHAQTHFRRQQGEDVAIESYQVHSRCCPAS